MTFFVYVDNSNVWIEGMRVSAVLKKLAPTLKAAMDSKIVDYDWGYDFGALYRAVCPDDEAVGRTSLFGSRPPANDSLWGFAESAGFQVFLFDRNAANKEKKVDTAIATQIMEDSYEYMKQGDTVVLVAGDRDYAPVIESLQKRGIKVRVVFWEHATGYELKAPPVDFVPLETHYLAITKEKVRSQGTDAG